MVFSVQLFPHLLIQRHFLQKIHLPVSYEQPDKRSQILFSFHTTFRAALYTSLCTALFFYHLTQIAHKVYLLSDSCIKWNPVFFFQLFQYLLFCHALRKYRVEKPDHFISGVVTVFPQTDLRHT